MRPTRARRRDLRPCLALLRAGQPFHSGSGNLRHSLHRAPGRIRFCSVAGHLWPPVSGSRPLRGGRSFLCSRSMPLSGSHRRGAPAGRRISLSRLRARGRVGGTACVPRARGLPRIIVAIKYLRVAERSKIKYLRVAERSKIKYLRVAERSKIKYLRVAEPMLIVYLT